MRLNELFDTNGITWESPTKATFSVGGKEYQAFFRRDAGGSNYYEFSFVQIRDDSHSGSFENTGNIGTSSPRVFGYVLQCLEEFIEKVIPHSIGFVGFDKDKRSSLYVKMAERMKNKFEKLGYKMKSTTRTGLKTGKLTYFTLDRQENSPLLATKLDQTRKLAQKEKEEKERNHNEWSSEDADLYRELTESDDGTMVLWHGGRDVESSYDEVRSHKRGRWEHGPGLYLTTSYSTALKYAKGSNKLYKVTVKKSGNDIEDVIIPLDDMISFINRYVKRSIRNDMIADLKSNMARSQTDGVRAVVLVNLCINYQAIANTNTDVLRQFLIDHGVDYARINSYDNGSVLVVINPKMIKKVEIVSPGSVKDDDLNLPFF